MNLASFQTAIQGVVKTATGYDGGHVIWANQTRDRPTRPFVELDIISSQATEYTEDSVSDTEGDPEDIEGEEVTLTTREHVDITVQIRVFSNAVVGSTKAFNVAQQIRTVFARESTQSVLDPIALIDRGGVRDFTTMLETEHEGRAVLDIRFRVAEVDTETTTFIETATVQTTIAQTGGDVVYDFEVTLPEE
jgi:hypothetical protein